LRVLAAGVLVSTCSTDSALSPGTAVESRLDVGFLFQAGGTLPIPVDTVLVELRRASDSTIAYRAELSSSQFAQQSDSLILTIQLELTTSPEQFWFYAAAIGGGITYYSVSGQVTAVAGRSVSTPAMVPTYVGPGSTADSVRLALSAAQVNPGDSVLATATVYENNLVVPGVPVGIGSSDSSLVLPRTIGFNQAWLMVSPTATGAVNVSAVTPTGLVDLAALSLGSPIGGPATVTAVSSTAQAGIVNQLVGQPPSVEVRDSSNAPLAGVTVSFAATAGNGTITGGTQVTNASGIATAGGWRLAQTVGSDTLTATVAGLPPVTFTATSGPTAIAVLAKDSGDVQSDTAGRTLAQQLVVQARDSFANLIPGLTVNWTPTDGSVAPTSGATDAQGRARTSWTLGFVQATPTVTAGAGGVQTIFTATTFFAAPTIQLSFTGIPGVGIGLTSVVKVQLNQPAAGNTLVTLTSGNPSLFTVSPGTVTIPQGATTDSVTITGLSAGTALLTASATGYTSGTLSVDVQNRNVSVPVTLNVPYGQTASLPIQLPAPAPAGGVTFTVASNNPTVVGIQTAQVTIGAGQVAANATVQGLLPGSAIVTVSNPAYNSATSTVNSTASLNIQQSSALLNTSFGDTVSVRFESNTQPIAAPSPGISVLPVIANPQCLAAAPSPATIATGQTTVALSLSYGGGATLPCTTQLKVTAANILADSINVTVNPTPPITLSPFFSQVGAALQEGLSVSLGASNHGGTTLTVRSETPAVGLIAPSTTGAGVDSVQVFIPNGNTSTTLYMQGLPGQRGTLTFTASATGFVPDTASVTVVAPGVQIEGFPSATTTLSTDSPFYVTVGVPNGQNTALSRYQNLRGGGTPLTATFSNQFPAVGTLFTSAQGAGSPRTATVQPGLYYTPTSVGSGGVAFRPVGAGQDTVTASIPGFVPMSNLIPRGVTVSQPTTNLSVNSLSIGSGLQEGAGLSLGASNHGGVTATVKSLNPNVLLVAPSTSSPGSDSIQIAFLNGQTGASFAVQALEGVVDSTYIEVTVPNFAPDSQLVRAVQPAMQIEGLGTSYATATGVVNFYVTVGLPNGQLTALSRYQNLRIGGAGPVSVNFSSRDTTIGTLVVTGDSGSPQAAQVQPGLYYTPTSVSSGGVGFLPVSGGTVDITAAASGFLTMSNSIPRTITVTQPTSSVGMNFSQIGAGLQESGFANLSASQHGGVTMVIKSLNPAAVLLAPNTSTAGSDSLVVSLANGQASTSFVAQAADGFTGVDTITVSVPGFVPDTTVVTVVVPGIQIEGLPASTTTLSPNSNFYGTIGVPNGQNTGLSRYQNRRAGGAPVVVTFTSNPASVAALVDTAGSAATRTAQIAAGTYYTPTTVSSGGVALDPLLGGQTQISAAATGFTPMTNSNPFTVTVTQPGITVSTNYPSVGAGLMESGNVSLGASQHGGVTVTLKSSDPAIALVSPNASTAGTDSIQVSLPNGTAGFSYYVHGLEGKTGSVALTAVAAGFTNGNGGITVTVPGIQLEAVAATVTTLDADDQIYATIGVPNVNNTALSRYQNVRAGGPGYVVSFGSSDTNTVRLVSQAGGPGTPQSATIVPGLYYTPTTIASGGVGARPVAVGTATLSVSTAGALQMGAAIRSQTVVQPTITMSVSSAVGAGLQTSGSVNLGAAQHGGVTLTITSATPGVLLVSPNSSTAGTSSIQIPFANGSSSSSFYVQGVEGQTGTIDLIATVDSRFVDDTLAVPVVQPGIDIVNLATSQTAGGADNSFYVQVGIPNGTGTQLQQVQNVRAGAPGPLTATLTSSSPTIGSFVDLLGGPASPRTVDIPIGQYYSPTSIATGGIGFRPLLAGSTTVTATAPGLATMTGTGVRVVTVN